MKPCSKFYGPVGAFFSRTLYRDAGLHWRGAGVCHLLLIVIVCALAQAVKIHFGFSTFVRTEAPAVLQQIPAITIKNGQVSCDAQQPWYIVSPDTSNTIAIIDTSGSITSLDDTDARILLTKTQVVAKKNAYETQSWDLSEVQDFSLTEERVTGWLNMCGMLVAPVIGVCMAVFSFIFRMIQVLAYAGIGMAFATMMNARITYAGAMRIAALAITPVMVTRTVLDMTRLLPPFAWAVFFVVAMVYLFIGVQACAQPEQPEQPEQPGQPEQPEQPEQAGQPEQQVPPMPPTVA